MVRIDSVHIKNFRSIRDSGPINIEPDVTVLVGPNEAGKTNFLKAIEKFAPNEKFTEDDLCFYEGAGDPEIEIKFSDASVQDIIPARHRRRISDNLSEKILQSGIDLTVTKYSDHSYDIEVSDHEEVIEQIEDERQRRVRRIYRQIRRAVEELSQLASNEPNLERGQIEHINHIKRNVFDANSDSIDGVTDSVRRTKALVDSLEGNLSEERKEEFEDISEEINHIQRRIDFQANTVDEAIVRSLPQATFKQNIPLIEDEVDVDTLIEEPDNYPIYKSLMEFAEIDLDRYYEIGIRQRNIKKKDAADALSQKFTKKWGQEEIVFDISFGGNAISLHISDSSESEDLATHRSRGFRYFLSFFIDLLAEADEKLNDELILLDDPGVYLHPDAQHHLREALEEIGKDNQVIYTTHSPSMINTDDLNSIRIIDRSKDEEGTYIDSHLTKHDDLDADVLAPIRSALGSSFADSLFASKSNILVEGYTDRLYLQRMSNYFQKNENGPTLSQEIAIVDVDGSKANYFAKLLNAEEYNYIILTDSDEGGENIDESLDEKIVDDTTIHSLGESLNEIGAEKGITIEDAFSADFYCHAVSETHEEIEKSDIEEAVNTPQKGIINELEGRMNELEGRGQITDSELRKEKVAEKIDEKIAHEEWAEEEMGDETIENFKTLISDLDNKINS